MNRLEQYIQPGWEITRLSDSQKLTYGLPTDENWVMVDYETDCYGNITKNHRPWLLPEWQEAIEKGFYME